jgi:hypothetical protein
VKHLNASRPACLLLAATLALGAAGCGESAGSPETTGEQPTTTSASAETTTTAAGTSTSVSPGQFLLIGGTPIGQLTPEQGVGAYPLFEWTAVPGAARYMLFVFDVDGVMFWAWEGTATSVYLGGLDQPPTPGSMGPALDVPMSWAVVAFDAGDNLVAGSATRPIAP